MTDLSELNRVDEQPATPKKRTKAPNREAYASSTNPLVETSHMDSLCSIEAYATFLYDYASHDPGEECSDEIQHGRAVAARILVHALQELMRIESEVFRSSREG